MKLFRCHLWLPLLLAVNGVASAATFSVLNMDTGTSGLNDTTVVAPVGGNTATTLGQARLNVIAEAGRVWGLRISSQQNIVIEASMAADTCSATTGVLASASPRTFFTTSSAPNVLLPAALSHALYGPDVNKRNDISVSIDSNVGTSTCLGGRSFYLGFDHANGSSIDLLNVLLHEIGHGLGFLSLTDSTGAPAIAGKFTGFEQSVYSESLGKAWPAMTNAERANASIASGTLVYNGSAINSHLSGYTTTTGLSSPGGHLRLYAPSSWSDGSSVSHWDTVATPNLLLEPFITANPRGFTDLTGCVLADMGWPGARCPDYVSATAQTVAVSGSTPTQVTLQGSDFLSTTSNPVSLTYAIVTQPSRGTLVAPNSLSATGGVTFTYTASSNVTATDTFTFQVSDAQGAADSASVTLNITGTNHAPVATAQSVSVVSGQSLAITLTGSDVDGNSLTYALLAGTGPTSGVIGGTAPNLTYTPNSGFVGSDSFQFRANDGQLNSAAATVSIAVTAPANHAPVANAQSVSVVAGQSVAIALTGSDVDGNALTYSLAAGFGPTSGVITGAAPNLTYTPNAGFVGSDSFQFRANDGQLNSAAVAVSITVTAAAVVASSSGGGAGGGGGGALDAASLSLLALLLALSGAGRGRAHQSGTASLLSGYNKSARRKSDA